jgi:glyoxylase-like metal-dependent hydrolase (beta-lactamase superfamily II)
LERYHAESKCVRRCRLSADGPSQKTPTILGAEMQITEEIFQVGGPGLTSAEDAAIYLLNFRGHAALVDAGCGKQEEKVIANIRSCDTVEAAIEYILLTHCHYDHTGGVSRLRQRLSCKVVSHSLDAPFLESGDNRVTAAAWYAQKLTPFSVDIQLAGAQEDIWLGDRAVTALHTPGHSPGSVVYVTQSEGKKVLFAQDVHGPLDETLRSNRADYQRSLSLLKGLEADILCEGHFGVYQGKDSVRKFIESFMDF